MLNIRTVCGDIPAESFGLCYAHEHLLGFPPPQLAKPDLMLNDEAVALEELLLFKAAGGRAIVEMTTPDYNRDAAGLRRLSQQSGVHIVCATGYNKDTYSKSMVDGQSVDQLAARYVREVTQGIDGTGVHAGLIKASSMLNEIGTNAMKMLVAAARAHHACGAPISTHTEAGTMALEQVNILQAEGVEVSHIIIGHLDRKLDWDYHLRLAETGVFFSFDQISKEKYYPDLTRARFIARLIDVGFGHQILLSSDMARRSYWQHFGGSPGFTYILSTFIPLLQEQGVSSTAIDNLLLHNPSRAFALHPNPSQPRTNI